MFYGKCKLHNILAYAMAVYCLASIYYFVRSRSVGTPFADSLTPEQIEIKNYSASVRKTLFVEGIVLAALVLLFMKPFESCQSS